MVAVNRKARRDCVIEDRFEAGVALMGSEVKSLRSGKASIAEAFAAEKKGESLLASTPVVVLSTILGRTPSIDEYKSAVAGINLTKFAPPRA